MTPSTSSSIEFQPPTTRLNLELGPDPVRILPDDDVTIFIVDAAVIDSSDTWYCESAQASKQYSRLMALSSKNASKSILFAAPPTEYMVADHWKEERKRIQKAAKALAKAANAKKPANPAEPKLKFWVHGGEGRGIVKQYGKLGYRTYGHLHVTVSNTDLEAVKMESCFEDLRRDHQDSAAIENYRSCPAADRRRNDFRIQTMADTAAIVRRRYPAAKIIFLLRGERIAGRYNELRQTGISFLAEFGEVKLGYNCNVATAIDNIVKLETLGTCSQPIPHIPNAVLSPVAPAWSDLRVSGEKSIMWYTDATFEPNCSVPKTILAAPDCVIRIVVDGCVSSRRSYDLERFVGRFGNEDIQLATLPEIEKELSRGDGRERRVENLERLVRIRETKRWTKKEIGPTSYPTVYSTDQPPALSTEFLDGDLAIRVELSKMIEVMEERTVGKRLLVVFITEDYGADQLMRSLRQKSTEYRCVRVDHNEKGAIFEEKVLSVMNGGWFISKDD